MWQLQVASGRIWIADPLPATVGSARGADVVVAHPSLSAEHARLSPGQGGTLLVEALGEGLVGVGGRRVRRASLRSGEDLVLGRLRFTVLGPGDGASLGRRPDASDATRGTQAPGRTAPRAVAAGTQRGPRRQRRAPAGAAPRSARRPDAGGFLRVDLGQLSYATRLLVAAGLLVLCAALFLGARSLVGLLG